MSKKLINDATLADSAEGDAVTLKSRRGVLKGLAAGSVAAMSATVPGIAAAKTGAQTRWQMESDIVIVGSGIAAVCAAIAAATSGASVIMLEKMPFYGGTTAKSGGVFWIPNNPYLTSQGVVDDRIDALRYMVRCAYPHRYDVSLPLLGISQHEFDLIAAFYDNGKKVVETLTASAGLKIMPWLAWDGHPFPDYYANLPENKVHRGRSLVCDVSGHPDRIIWPQGGGSGESMLWQLKQKFSSLPIKSFLEHSVLGLTRNSSGVINGVVVDTGGDKPINVHARKAVIFCSGGFAHNPELAANFLRGHIWGACAAPGSTGDFVPIAMGAGAALGNMNNAWWGQVPVEVALKTRSVAADIWSTPGDSMMQVNRYGRRFANEKIQYNERTQVHFTWDPVRCEYPNLLSFMIWDARTAKHYAGYDPIPAANAKHAHVIEGATLVELAANIEARLAAIAAHTGALKLDANFIGTLRETIARFNGMAEKGRDEDFSRGNSPIEISFQFYDLEKAPNPYSNITMYPISDNGPYYAVILGAGALDTKGGAVVNAKGQVLDAKGQPLPGLYAAGNCAASPAAQAYWGGGGTIGPHMTFGYLAGQSAAAEGVKLA